MKRTGCDLEGSIVEALSSAGISDNARRHLGDCEICRDAVAADAFMKEFAVMPVAEPILPDPALIWLKAELVRERHALAGLVQSISWWQTIGFALVALGWAVMLTWKWSTFEAIAAAFDSGALLWSVANESLMSVPFVLTVVTLACATVAMAFQSVMLEE